MATIKNSESARQALHGAKAFGTKRERPALPTGRKYLVLGDYVKGEDGAWVYQAPTKLCKQFGIDPKQAILWHPGDGTPPPAAAKLIVVTPAGIRPGHTAEAADAAAE